MSRFRNLCDISDVVIGPLTDSIYLKPCSMTFKHNGINRKWDLMTIHDSVAIIIYNISRNVLVLVKQFRPAVYLYTIPENERFGSVDVKKYPPEKGVTLELCAGIVDKNKSLEEIAKEETLEECGYLAPTMECASCYRSGVGFSCSNQTLFYCEVTDEMKVSEGGGVDDESIQVVEMTIPEINDYISQSDIASPPSFLYGIHWFLKNKFKQL